MTDIVERLLKPGGGVLADEVVAEIEWLRKERLKLIEDLGRAHAGVLPWIEQVVYLNGRWARNIGLLQAASDGLREAGAIYAADGLMAKVKEEEEWMKQRLAPLSKQTATSDERGVAGCPSIMIR
jgi:hypothetical protein